MANALRSLYEHSCLPRLAHVCKQYAERLKLDACPVSYQRTICSSTPIFTSSVLQPLLTVGMSNSEIYPQEPFGQPLTVTFTRSSNATSSSLRGAPRILHWFLGISGHAMVNVLGRVAHKMGLGPNAATARLEAQLSQTSHGYRFTKNGDSKEFEGNE